MSGRSSLPASLALLLALGAPGPALAAWPSGLGTGVVIAPASKDQYLSTRATLPDGAGGMFVGIMNNDGVTGDVILQRMTSAGTVSPGWPAGGVAVCSLPSFRSSPQIIADGAGGAILVWLDYRSGTRNDLYAQRVTAAGTIAPGWIANGVPLATQIYDKYSFSVCTDGAGGAFVAFDLAFSPPTDIDVYAAHVTASGVVSTGVINANGAVQDQAVVSSDLAGGFYVAYEDNIGGDYNINAIRMNASFVAQFPSKIVNSAPGDQRSPRIVTLAGGDVRIFFNNYRYAYARLDYVYLNSTGQAGYDFGTPVYDSGANQGQQVITPDDAGGAWICWVEDRISGPGAYLQHWNKNGSPYPTWPTGGLFLGTGYAGQNWYEAVAPDGTNGAIVAWNDENNYSGGIFGTHVDAFGALRPLSHSGGNLVFYNGGYGSGLGLAADGLGGAFMVWIDYSDLVRVRAYAQHLDDYLQRGDPRAVSTGVKDIRADQGGHVEIRWQPSWLDNKQDFGIGSYWIWRQAPLLAAQQGVARGGAWSESGAAPVPGQRTFRHSADQAAAYAWEYLDAQPANQSALYSYVAATTTDSITGHNPYSVFMVEAHAASDSRAAWPSAPDSGYSVDNLPPTVPAPFTGTFSTVTGASLAWGPSDAADLQGYRLYRGTSAAFVPGPGNLVAQIGARTYLDPSVVPHVYKLTAIDVHGNESAVATLIPNGALGVGGDVPLSLAFTIASGNPSHLGATLRLALPHQSAVRVTVFDAAGREVRRLADGPYDPGTWSIAWDGSDGSGNAAPGGLYFVRLVLPGETRTQRIALLR